MRPGTEVIQTRLNAWAKTPTENFEARHTAWCLYVDARDGLPDGTQIISTPYQAPQADNQMSLFRRAVA